MRVDPTQASAIQMEEGPAMVLAGPGSGKTTVITHRIEYLIRERHIDPSSILVITFSRAAAREMQERFLILMNRQRFPVTFGTFHAIFFHILKTAYGFTTDQIADSDRQLRFIREYIRRLRLEGIDETDLARSILAEIGREKSGNTAFGVSDDDPSDIPSVFGKTHPGQSSLRVAEPMSMSGVSSDIFRLVSGAYEEFLRQNGLIDFEDMLVMTEELLTRREDIRRGWQERFRYILVDEFQDINPVQYRIVRMLAEPENNLFIVGDDDQSIYRFRGSHPEIMLHFDQDYPGAERVLLATNYRSVPEIVHVACNLISHNEKRFQKDIRAASAKGLDPVMASFPTQSEQNLCVISTIKELSDNIGIPYHEMAVLFRTNAQPGLLMRQFSDCNIPFISREHIPNLFDHWIVKDINTYLSLAGGRRSRENFLRVMNRPSRYLSRESLPFESCVSCSGGADPASGAGAGENVSYTTGEQYESGNVMFGPWKQYYKGQGKMLAALSKFETDLNALSAMRPWSAINYIRKAVGYEDYLRECAKKRHMSADELFGVLDELQEDAASFDTVESWMQHQDEVKAEWEKRYSEKNAPASAVAFSTLHASKGLEFDTVFIVDVDENVIPDKKAVSDDDLEEERRLFYVGMTRAKRRLYLFHSGKIKNKEMAPSRFLSECKDPASRPEELF